MELNKGKLITISATGLTLFIAFIVGNYFLVQLPKQQEISLRKRVYELCLKEFNQYYEATNRSFVEQLAKQVVTKMITEQEMKQKLGSALLPILSRKDEIINTCIEKRLLEYKK